MNHVVSETQPNTTPRPSRLTHASTGSSSSSTRHGLDPDSHSPIVVFHWLGRDPLEKSSEAELSRKLEKLEELHDHLRVTKMQIPRMTLCMEVERHNLYKGDEHQRYRNYPNYNSSLASIKLPAYVFWPRMAGVGYENLYIVSPELSHSSCPEESYRDSTSSPDHAFAGAE